ncbi:hypothetical protein BGX27_008673 [Mortierella sp. AM989]|nr:hypothetical protein BGX27_008673 [Mortierella sp. AM989]
MWRDLRKKAYDPSKLSRTPALAQPTHACTFLTRLSATNPVKATHKNAHKSFTTPKRSKKMLLSNGHTPRFEKECADLLESRQTQHAVGVCDRPASRLLEGDKKASRLVAFNLSELLRLPLCIADTPVDVRVVPDAVDYYQWSTPNAQDVREASAAILSLNDGPIARVLETTDLWKCLVKLTEGGVVRKKTKGNLFKLNGPPYDKNDSVKPWISTCVKAMGAYPPGQAVRDFYASWYRWTHAGTMTGREAVASAKALVLTIAADYRDAEDGMGSISLNDYAEGMGNALRGEGDYAHALDLVKVSSSLIEMRNQLTERLMEYDVADIADEWVGPHEFMGARWWEAALLPAFNMAGVISPATGNLMSGACGNGSITVCAKAWNALETTIQYNEILDIMPDEVAGEPLNEIHAAVKYGSGSDHSRYHDVIASAVVDVFECRCGGAGHEWARRVTQTCAWFALAPRYGGLAQQRTMRMAQQQKMQIAHNACVWDHDVFCNTTPIITRSDYGAYNDLWTLAGVESAVDVVIGCQACAQAVRHLNARCSFDGHKFTSDELHAAVAGGDIISLVCRVRTHGQCPEWLVEPVMAVGRAIGDIKGDLESDAKLYITFDIALDRALAEGGLVAEQGLAMLGLLSYLLDVTPLSVFRIIYHTVERA